MRIPDGFTPMKIVDPCGNLGWISQRLEDKPYF